MMKTTKMQYCILYQQFFQHTPNNIYYKQIFETLGYIIVIFLGISNFSENKIQPMLLADTHNTHINIEQIHTRQDSISAILMPSIVLASACMNQYTSSVSPQMDTQHSVCCECYKLHSAHLPLRHFNLTSRRSAQVYNVDKKVQSEDHLPTGLCSTCTTALLDACHFRKLCLQAATQWNTTLQLLNRLEMKGNVKATFAVIEAGQISFLYDFCGGPATGKSALKRLSTLAGEKELNHKQKQAVTHSSQCVDCGKKFQKVQSLYHHLKESSDLKRACQYCAQIMHRDDLVVHLKEIHDKEPYPCKKCPAILKNKKQYNSHLDKVHTVGVVYCGECGRSFRSSYALRAHVSIHAPKKCPACDRLFRNQTCYLYHVKQCCDLNVNRQDAHRTKTKVTVQVANQFADKKVKVGLRGSANSECICDYCRKKFAGKKFVCAHIQTVHMKNTHKPCVYCDKILPSAYMTVHLKKHRPSDTFTCEFCGFSLKSKLGYTQHIRIHTGEKPYPCKYCNESFLGSSRRSEHVRNKHNKSNIVLKYACNKCPARFRLPYHLKKHIASKHVERKIGHHSHRV